MPTPVTGTVKFTVSVTHYSAGDGKFMVQTVETGLVTYGSTPEEAERLNGLANVKMVKRWKAAGRLVLDRFMKKHGIVDYQIDEQEGVEIPGERYEPTERGLDLAA